MPTLRASGALTDYAPLPRSFDEMQSGPGLVRPHWDSFASRLGQIGPAALNERRLTVRHLLREHGVTYNVHADGRSDMRTWELDTVPLIIAPDEWRRLEAALIQRSHLLNLVLADFYGDQKLFHEGHLPPALLHANPGFLRPCHGVKPPGGRYLTLSAVDLARAPGGQWWVLADRTQAPSGLGYTLENRVITSRVLADEFRHTHVRRVASFFIERKQGLNALSPWTNSPNIVLLTPGPFSETYFEHAYLARYLGYPLVEGSDLTVRDRRVFIRTIEGLQPVDVIIRRVDDTFCDPLELRSNSFLGVPGLIEAARAGNVAISNALGSGAVEAPALLAFLPKLSRHLLGEELRLPNVATWWCGQVRERAQTLARLGSMVVKRAFVSRPLRPAFGATLNDNARRDLAARIEANPHAFVGQEPVALSTAPVWTGERFEPRPLILRCYVCSTPDGYVVLPGGLTRVSASPDSPVVSAQFGGGSKDTWVVSEAPVENVTLLSARGTPVVPERAFSSVASRTAENLFWLGRYSERLEDSIRLLRVAIGRLVGESGAVEQAELNATVQGLVDLERLPQRCARRIPVDDLLACLGAAIHAPDEPGSVRTLLQRIAYLTASVRDRLSADTWRVLNHMQTEFPAEPKQFDAGAGLAALHRLIFQLAALSGMEMENMTRGFAWRFLEMGRRIERAGNLAGTTRALLEFDPTGETSLVPLLEFSDSTMTYRRRYAARPDVPTTLKLLFADASNPRSLVFQLESLSKHLEALPGMTLKILERQRFDALLTLHAATDFLTLGNDAREGNPGALLKRLEQFKDDCWALSDALTRRYFSHALARVN